MASDTKNVKLGVCQIKFGGHDLGYTKGGVEVEVKTETKKVMIDQFGNSEINEYITGRTVSIKVPMAETTVYNLVKIMPGSVLTMGGSGAYASGTLTFTTMPANTETILINGLEFVFRTAQSSAITGSRDIQRGGSLSVEDCVKAAEISINSAMNADLASIRAEANGLVLTLYSTVPGVSGNSLTLDETVTGCTRSGATLSGGVDPSRVKVNVPHAIGTSLMASAQRLSLHPIANVLGDRSGDFTVPLANTPGEMNYSYKLDDERIFSCTFMGYPDSATGVLFTVGDTTIY